MKSTYSRVLADIARIKAGNRGHTFAGRFKRCGLSYVNHCATCHHPVGFTPAWPYWGGDKYFGIALHRDCQG